MSRERCTGWLPARRTPSAGRAVFALAALVLLASVSPGPGVARPAAMAFAPVGTGLQVPAAAGERLAALTEEVENWLFGEAVPGAGVVVPAPNRGRVRPFRDHDWEAGIAELQRELAAIPRDELPLDSRVTRDVVEYALSGLAMRGRRPDYRERIRHHTTLPLRAEQLGRLGLQEVERLRGEMDEVRRQVGFDGDLEAFFEHLRDEALYHAGDERAFATAARWIARRAHRRLDRLFGNLPRTSLRIEVVSRPDFPAAGYRAGSVGGQTVPGRVLLNTAAVEGRPLWALEAMMLHEGYPGHHLQQMLALESDEIPLLQRRMHVSAFVEGWGLYAEGLGQDLGMYRDPYSRFGYLNSRMWRACRLVVDTGLHAFGWSREWAREFMAANLGLPEREIAVEVERYADNPGQALAYLMGALTIEELRAEAEAELGASFDLSAFHDEVLRRGALPLPTLVEVVQAWIARRADSGRS